MSYRFAKVYRPEHSNPAIGNAVLHLATRRWLLALDRVQRGGHAPLGSGGLQLILTNEKGEPHTPSRYRQARGNLIEAGMPAPSASARCLLIPSTVASTDVPPKKRLEECDNIAKGREPVSLRGMGAWCGVFGSPAGGRRYGDLASALLSRCVFSLPGRVREGHPSRRSAAAAGATGPSPHVT
ncbi:hypothetical protein [Streptomyces ziwulingensis]|uniref:Uncharacterized protein n=1 Tax=Streptomyces ziwulingensis TaxID=1045501 RepID=A0ABP9CCR7_9ACTN